jgi:ribosomal protein L11 methyltransferase
LRRVSFRVPAHEAEIGRARLLELVPDGFEERDAEGGIELVACVDRDTEARLRAAFGDVTTAPVEPGWEDGWRAFHRSVQAGGLWIGPPWEPPPEGVPAVVVDPGRAFGTGAHPTTRLCVELLARVERGSLLDAGCGSGVLAVAAARLGFDPVHAVDVDEMAVEVARETARANGVRIAVTSADVLREELPPVDLVVANIELGAVDELLARRPAARAITSGYLATERASAPRWRAVDRLELDGWAADALEALPLAVRARPGH